MKTSLRCFVKQVCALVVSECIITTTVPMPARAGDDSSPASTPVGISKTIGTTSASASMNISSDTALPAVSSNSGPIGRSAKGDLRKSPDMKRKVSPDAAGKAWPNKIEANAVRAGFGSLAFGFIENKGQFDPRVKFQVSNGCKTLWLTQSGVIFDFLRAEQNLNYAQHKHSGRRPGSVDCRRG
jgi:hypothetical protein